MRILAYVTHMGHPAVWENMLSLVKALSYMGHEVRLCDVNDNNEMKGVLYQFLVDPGVFDMSIGFNDMGLEWQLEGVADPVYLYEELDFPHVSIMLDEPFNQCVSGYDLPCKNHIVTYLDRSDLKALEFMYPDKKMWKLFLPLGGSMNRDSTDPLSGHREYDVVVSAGVWSEYESTPRWRNGGGGVRRAVASILDDVVDILKSYPVNVMTAFQEALHARGMYDAGYLKAMQPYFWPMLFHIKPWRRHQMVKCLAESGLKVDVFGGGWEKVSFADALVLHGAVPYAEMLDVISKTKVLVQDEAVFNDGAHDRVFTGMLNGAVVVSEYSSYLDELFENQHDLFMFDWQHTKEQMEVIPQLLSDESYRLTIATNAYGKVVRDHTWKNRAERIIEAVELFYDMG